MGGLPEHDGKVHDIGCWKPARKFPEHYPGECPDHDYLIWDDRVFGMTHSPGGGFAVPGAEGQSLDRLLGRLGLPPLGDRIAVLAYGANRNPATLHIKLANYRYVSPNGTDDCLPVLRATLADADVAACGVHGQGYLYGELLLNSEHSQGTLLDVQVCMADRDQLRVLNDSEGIREGGYHLAWIPGVTLTATGEPVSAVGYVADAHTWVSPVHTAPLGFTSVPARGRRYPAMTATGSLGHVIDVLGLRAGIRAVTGLPDDDRLAPELAKYLNGQWWYAFNTGQPAIAGYGRVLDLMRAAMAESLLSLRTHDHLAERNLVIETTAAYTLR